MVGVGVIRLTPMATAIRLTAMAGTGMVLDTPIDLLAAASLHLDLSSAAGSMHLFMVYGVLGAKEPSNAFSRVGSLIALHTAIAMGRSSAISISKKSLGEDRRRSY
jgi:hypothetical protein